MNSYRLAKWRKLPACVLGYLTDRQARCLPHLVLTLLLPLAGSATAEPPVTEYIFPAGGQRGTTVDIRVGAHYLHGGSPFQMDGPGIDSSDSIEETKTVWFEGPMIFKPASQGAETYPRDHAGQVKIDADAPLGTRAWRLWTSQGVVPSRLFVVGDLPEIIEEEIDGTPVPQSVELPVTINGRVFPREDVDIWTFPAEAGQPISCEMVATSIGSPLDSVLELYGPDGRQLAFNDDAIGSDSRIELRAPTTGVYRVHVYDSQYRGFQQYVYRLTISTDGTAQRVFPLGGRVASETKFDVVASDKTESSTIQLPDLQPGVYECAIPIPGTSHSTTRRIDLDRYPEWHEDKAREGLTEFPATINGQITTSEPDRFPLNLTEPGKYTIQLLAQSLGSHLDAKVAVVDSDGKVIATWGDPNNPAEINQTLNVKTPGRYTLQVESLWPESFGQDHAYRLKISLDPAPDFTLSYTTDALTIDRGATVKFKVQAVRVGAFKGPIALSVAGLPDGVTCADVTIAEGKKDTEVVLTAAENAPVQLANVHITGKAMIADLPVERPLTVQRAIGHGSTVDLHLMVAMPTPFTVDGLEFQTRYGARGTVFRRHYVLHRNGFSGPLTVRLADRQIRHLQGMTGPVMQLGKEVTEFDYPVYVPTWLEMNRTSRTVVMAVGKVGDEEGRMHTVAFTSGVPKDQIILLTAPSPINIQTETPAVGILPGGAYEVPIRVNRGQIPDGEVTLELMTAEHFGDIRAETVKLLPGETRAVITIRVGDKLGHLNMPATIRATTRDANGDPVIADVKVELFKAES